MPGARTRRAKDPRKLPWRAANIPARYQLGTIEIGAEQLKNWVGGVTSAEAAQQIIAQGGIASRGLLEGGQIAKFRMEHVWVQAYVNWAPSRGARAGSAGQHVNPNARQNAWVPLDAAYKQYQYTPGMNLAQEVPLDAQALLSAAQTGATVNEAQGWVQNLNQAAIQSQLSDYQNQLKAHIEASPGGADTTVGQVIGRQIIPQKSWELLAGTLAHPVIQRGAQMAALPQSLQHRFSFRLSEAGLYGEEGNNHLNYTAKLSQIEGKRLTLNYSLPLSNDEARRSRPSARLRDEGVLVGAVSGRPKTVAVRVFPLDGLCLTIFPPPPAAPVRTHGQRRPRARRPIRNRSNPIGAGPMADGAAVRGDVSERAAGGQPEPGV